MRMLLEGQKLESVLNTVIDAVITITPLGIIQTFNQSATKMFLWTQDEAIGSNVKMLMPEAHSRNHDRYLSDYMETGIAKVIGAGRRLVAKRKDGSEFKMDLALSEVKGDGFHIFTGIIRDITKQLEDENKLLVERQKLTSVLDTVVDAIITITPDGSIQSFNKAASRMFGYEETEVLAHNVKMLMPENHAKNHDTYLSNYLRTGVAKVLGSGRRLDALRKNGSTFTMDLSLSEVKGQGYHLFTGIIRDITKQLEDEQTVIMEREKLNSVFNTVVDAIITIDPAGSIQSFNDAAVKMFGYEREEVMGQNVKMLTPPEHRVNHDKYLRAYVCS